MEKETTNERSNNSRTLSTLYGNTTGTVVYNVVSEVMYKLNTDFIYYIELNGVLFADQPFETYEAAYEYIMESGMYYEGEWEIMEWPVD